MAGAAKNEGKKSNKPEISMVDVYSLSGEKVDSFELNSEIFNAKVNKVLLHQVLAMYMANQRQGNASTKTRGEVRGGGQKPWGQRGTGRARAGSIRSPLWRGGGIIFGPRVRDFSYSLPQKARRLALLEAIKSKIQANDIVIFDKIEIERPKTKEMLDV